MPAGLEAGMGVCLTFASICSGSEMLVMVLLAISAAFRKRGVKLTLKHVFSCEKDARKQPGSPRSIRRSVLKKVAGSQHMGKEWAHCEKHGQQCR
eukprot:3664101-Karenia_brevis.AAC.1